MPINYLPRYTDRPDPRDPDPVQPHEGTGRDLGGCPRCGIEVGEDRELCENCRGHKDDPLDLEDE